MLPLLAVPLSKQVEPPTHGEFRIQDIGCRMRDEGCGMQAGVETTEDARCRMQDVGCKVQDMGCEM